MIMMKINVNIKIKNKNSIKDKKELLGNKSNRTSTYSSSSPPFSFSQGLYVLGWIVC